MPRIGRIRHDQSLPRRRNHRGGSASHIDPSIEPSDARGDAGQETQLRHICGLQAGERNHEQAIAVRDCADRNGRCWDFGAVGRRRGSWRRSDRMLL